MLTLEKIVLAVALTVVPVMASSCAESPSGGDSSIAEVPVLFKVVPSDALALVSSSRVSRVLSYYDSTSALHNINFGKLADSRAVLSISCYSSPVPVLALEAGRTVLDVSPEVTRLRDEAEGLGFHTALCSLDDRSWLGLRVLIICPSSSVLQTVLRHIDEGASIADVPLFDRACKSVRKGADCIMVRPPVAERLLPKSFLAGLFPRSAVMNFAASTADWIVLSGKDGSFRVDAVSGRNGRSFFDFLDMLEPERCKICGILPPSPRFVLDYTIPSVGDFRAAVERHLDANVLLDRYRDTIRVREEACGRSPLDWERALDVKEAAVVVTDSISVILIRPARKPEPAEPAVNPHGGFASALYGFAFDIEDSWVAVSGNWLVYGSRQNIRRFLSACGKESRNGVVCRMMCITDNWTFIASDKGNLIELR